MSELSPAKPERGAASPAGIPAGMTSPLEVIEQHSANLAKALQEANSQLREVHVRDAMRRRGSERNSDASTPAELADIRHASLLLSGTYSGAHTQMVRDLDRLCPLCRMIETHWANQAARFYTYQDDEAKLGYRLIHPDHYRPGVDVSKLERTPEFRKVQKEFDELLNNPCTDDRLGNSFPDLMHQIRENFRIWDLVAIAFFREQGKAPTSTLSNLGQRPEELRKSIQGVVVLDGGSLEPVYVTLQRMVARAVPNETWRRMNDEQLIVMGKTLLAAEFPGMTPEQIDDAGWIQRDLQGMPRRLFTRNDILVFQKNKTTALDRRGWGFSPLQQSVFVLQNWLRQLFYAIKQHEPGINHLRQILYLTGGASTQAMANAVWQQLLEHASDSENWGVSPIIGLPAPVELKKLDFDPQARWLQQLGEAMTMYVSIFCGLHGVTPRDLNMPSLARTEEAGGLSSRDASYEQQLARNEGMWARMAYESAILNRLAEYLYGPRVIRHEWTGIMHTASEKTRIENTTARKWQAVSEDRIAWGMDELPEDARIFDLGYRKVDPTQWPKELIQPMIQLLQQESMAQQQQQAMEQQAMGAAWQGAQQSDQAEPGGPLMGEEDEEAQGVEPAAGLGAATEQGVGGNDLAGLETAAAGGGPQPPGLAKAIGGAQRRIRVIIAKERENDSR